MSLITMSRTSTAYAADNYSVRELASHDAVRSLLAQRYGSTREVIEFQRRTKSASQKSWTEKAAEGISTVAALGGRHILRDELVARGIGLE